MFDFQRLARKCILDRKEYVPGKPIEEVEREIGLTEVVKLALNENPLGTSPLAMEAMIRELKQNTNRYPESLCYDLSKKLAQKHRIDPSQVFIDNGEDAVITMIGLTFINPGDEIMVGGLTFPAYENIATKMDGICVRVPMTSDYRLDINQFTNAINAKSKLICLCNPNNPTGTIVTKGEFEKLIKSTPDNVIVVSDEAYFDFVEDHLYPESISYLKEFPNLIILRTFSKVHGLAGIRVGYAIAHPQVVKLMLKAREPFPVNRAAQAGALGALDDGDFIKATLQINREGREQFYREFERMKLRYVPSQANFVFVDIGRPVGRIFEAMLHKGVVVRPLGYMGFPNGIRITVGTKTENERAIAALEKALIGEGVKC